MESLTGPFQDCCGGLVLPPVWRTKRLVRPGRWLPNKPIARSGRIDLCCIHELGYMKLDRHGTEVPSPY
ncbi:hypothetical protein [Streptomyces sp. NPDC058667]|uniref:hypothetical protein n=1 Tax=Streptomyces sp. NPDC058667 TaxID=3346588 RepID=UPI00365E5386